MKKILLISFICILCISLLSGCGKKKQENTISDSDGNMLYYTLGEVTEGSHDGFYVYQGKDKKGNLLFSPVMSGMSHFDEDGVSDMEGQESMGRFIWFADTGVAKFDSVAPVVDDKHPLVGIFSDEENMPDEYTLEKFKDQGYTIGATFAMDEDQLGISLNTDTLCENSSIKAIVDSNSLDGVYKIGTFNGSRKQLEKALRSVDGDTGLIMGLTKNAKYELGIYNGTRLMSTKGSKTTLRADTRFLTSEGTTPLTSNPYTETDNGYFLINIPDNITPGYYYINDAGLFRYR